MPIMFQYFSVKPYIEHILQKTYIIGSDDTEENNVKFLKIGGEKNHFLAAGR